MNTWLRTRIYRQLLRWPCIYRYLLAFAWRVHEWSGLVDAVLCNMGAQRAKRGEDLDVAFVVRA